MDETLEHDECTEDEAIAQFVRRQEDEINALLAEREHLRRALVIAGTDIRQWLQLARRQREMMNQDLGWCPTERGIGDSEAVLDGIAATLSMNIAAHLADQVS